MSGPNLDPLAADAALLRADSAAILAKRLRTAGYVRVARAIASGLMLVGDPILRATIVTAAGPVAPLALALLTGGEHLLEAGKLTLQPSDLRDIGARAAAAVGSAVEAHTGSMTAGVLARSVIEEAASAVNGG